MDIKKGQNSQFFGGITIKASPPIFCISKEGQDGQERHGVIPASFLLVGLITNFGTNLVCFVQNTVGQSRDNIQGTELTMKYIRVLLIYLKHYSLTHIFFFFLKTTTS